MKFNIIQISKLYRRSPREVAIELVNIGVIHTASAARGYDLRIHFEYFKRMYENETLIEIEKTQFQNYYTEFKKSIDHMQCDIAQLKQTVNEIKELLIHKPT